MSLLTTIFGTKSGREIKKIQPLVNQINDLYDTLEGKDESYLAERTNQLKCDVQEKIQSIESKKLKDISFDSIRNNDRFKLLNSEIDIFIQREKLKFINAGLIPSS